MLPEDFDEPFLAELRSLLAAGEKIEAIKRFRARTGAGLKEAKDAVEALERGEALKPKERASAGSIEHEVAGLLDRGQKIDAIKLYRERTGAGLKDAKDAVERIAFERGIAGPGGTGCFGVALAAIVAMAWAAVARGH